MILSGLAFSCGLALRIASRVAFVLTPIVFSAILCRLSPAWALYFLTAAIYPPAGREGSGCGTTLFAGGCAAPPFCCTQRFSASSGVPASGWFATATDSFVPGCAGGGVMMIGPGCGCEPG